MKKLAVSFIPSLLPMARLGVRPASVKPGGVSSISMFCKGHKSSSALQILVAIVIVNGGSILDFCAMSELPDSTRSLKGKAPAEIELAKEQAQQKTLTNIISVCLAPAVICVVLGGYFFCDGYQQFHGKGSHAGAWGDFGSYLQGTTGSLWALAGVFIIFVAFLMQLRQLKEQREQFKLQLQRQEAQLEDQRKQFEAERADQQKQIEAQKVQFEAQQERLGRQSFDTAFFQLLDLHSRTTNQLVVTISSFASSEDDVYHGRACFRASFNTLQTAFITRISKDKNLNMPGLYVDFYQTWEHELGPYFRNLYNIIKFVKDSNVGDKRRYTNLVRAQLSSYELLLLFYDCISVYGEKFKPLVEEFGLLKHVDFNRLLDRKHVDFFSGSAWH